MKINDACDYIILRLTLAGSSLNLLKLQKLLYYAQAWHLAFNGEPLFDGKFQAWVHGPVNREIYDRFAASKSLYSELGESDIIPGFDPSRISEDDVNHLNAILDAYAKFTGSQLEALTHGERPWEEAREGCRPSQRCEREISERSMQEYYAARLK
jgi:uncharacterized phage-associated protein